MIADLLRRVRNALAFGVTAAPVSVAQGNVAQVQVILTPLELPTLRLVEQRGFASNMPVGTPIIALFQSGDRSNGIVCGSTSPNSRPTISGPEDAAMYGYTFTIIIKNDGVHITAPDVFMSGNLHVNGEVWAKAGSTSSQVGLSTHHHQPDSHGDSVPGPIPGT
jgi:phage gp45-like